MTNVAELLAASGLAAASDAVQAIRSGWSVSAPSDVDELHDFRETYVVRLQVLRKMRSAPAAKLANSVAELVNGLDGAESAQIVTISGPAEHDFQVFLANNGARVVGCLRVVSALRVSPDRWTEWWRHAT